MAVSMPNDKESTVRLRLGISFENIKCTSSSSHAKDSWLFRVVYDSLNCLIIFEKAFPFAEKTVLTKMNSSCLNKKYFQNRKRAIDIGKNGHQNITNNK